MSNINPQSIDGTYPIAGQDNNSQGFRDNFTNTVNNFTFAAAELTDLQQNAVLKAALGSVGQTGTPTNDLNYAYLTHAQMIGTVETKKAIGNVSYASPNFTVDWSQGHFQTVELVGNTAALTAFSSTWPATNLYTRLRLQCNTYSESCNLALPAAVSTNITSIQGHYVASGNKINLPAGSVYVFEFSTWDGGATVAIQDVLRNYDIVANGATTSFTTVTAGTVNAVTIGNTGATVTGTTGAFGGNVIGGLAQFAAINNTPVGNATASTGAFTTLSMNSVSGNVLITDPIGAGSSGANLTVKGTIQYKYWDYSNVLASSDSITLAPGGDSLKLVQINGNLAVGYNSPIVAGSKVEYTVQNISSSNVWVNLPNTNTNTGKGNVFVLHNSFVRFVFTAFGANTAMVAVAHDGLA